MSDYKIPDLPSDDDLGITDEDRRKYQADDKPELSDKELAALLGEAPRRPEPAPKPLEGPAAPSAAGARPKAPPAKAPPAGKEPPRKPPAPAAPEPTAPRGRWGGLAMLMLLAAAAWLGSGDRYLPAPVPANAPDTAFSSARAMAHLVEIARRPHPPGSPAHAMVRDYLVERLRALGLEPEVQTTTSLLARDALVRSATVRNIVARIPGTASTGTIVLTAHYDGREISRAAADAGAGVVAILETVRALRAGPPVRNDVLVLITDAEELGLMGARAFVEEHPAMADVRLVVSLEMRGAGGPSIMFETAPENGWVVRALRDSGARPFANSVSYEVYRRLPNDTDFTPFREAGRQGLNFAGIGRASVYHQAYDAPENLSEATLQHHGDNALRVTRWLGDQTLDPVSAPDVAFFSAPVVGMVIYDPGLSLPLAAALVVLALVTLPLALRRRGGGSAVAAGAVLGVVLVAAGAGTGWALLRWVPRFHPEHGSLHGSAVHGEGWYVLALAAASLAVTASLLAIARRRLAAAPLAWGALVLPLAAMAWVSFAYPSAAANLQIPLAAAYLAAAAAALPEGGRLGGTAWLLAAVLALPVLALLVPMVEFVWLGLSLRAAPVVGALVALTLLLLLPALDRLRAPNAWWAPLAAAGLGAAFLAVGIRSAAPDAARPAPSTLAYALDHGTGEALWITDSSRDPVDAAAHAWAAERAGGAFDEPRPLERFGFGRREPRTAAAAAVDARRPEAWALSDTVVGNVRRLRLALRSAVGAELLQLRFPEGGGTRVTAVNGRTLPAMNRVLVLEHWGTPDPLVLVDLESPAGSEPAFDVLEHHFRPQELLGEERFRRPPELAPDITWLSDRALFLTPASALGIIPGPPPLLAAPEAGSVPEPAAADTVGGTPGEGQVTPPAVAPSSGSPPPD